jgi:hypothetical protein
MGRLHHAIAALDILGSLMQAVPVIGDSLKSATELAMLICETVEVRICCLALYMRSIFSAEDEGEP